MSRSILSPLENILLEYNCIFSDLEKAPDIKKKQKVRKVVSALINFSKIFNTRVIWKVSGLTNCKVR